MSASMGTHGGSDSTSSVVVMIIDFFYFPQ